MNVMVRMSKLEPAYSIIKKFDPTGQGKVSRGAEAIASRIGLTRSAVSKWALPVKQSGTGGYVPPRYYDDILAFANEAGIELDPKEFVVRPEVAA
jgi:uncharacterized protein YgbK (DUF1537 family)